MSPQALLVLVGIGVGLLCCLGQCCLFGTICCPPPPPPAPGQTPCSLCPCPSCSCYCPPDGSGSTGGGSTGGGSTGGGSTGGGSGTTKPRYKTCYVKVCDGCCCKTDSQTVRYEQSCPPDQCPSDCECCRSNSSCYPLVSLKADPPKLFVGQSFNLSYRAEGNSCCGNLQCTLTSTYQGFNCGQSGMIGICPSDAQGVNVCDPNNQLSKINLTGKTLYEGTISITTHSQYWGNCLYSLNCKNNCGLPQSATQTVMTVPVPLWGEESPISNLFSPLKPFISLFSL